MVISVWKGTKRKGKIQRLHRRPPNQISNLKIPKKDFSKIVQNKSHTDSTLCLEPFDLIRGSISYCAVTNGFSGGAQYTGVQGKLGNSVRNSLKGKDYVYPRGIKVCFCIQSHSPRSCMYSAKETCLPVKLAHF